MIPKREANFSLDFEAQCKWLRGCSQEEDEEDEKPLPIKREVFKPKSHVSEYCNIGLRRYVKRLVIVSLLHFTNHPLHGTGEFAPQGLP